MSWNLNRNRMVGSEKITVLKIVDAVSRWKES